MSRSFLRWPASRPGTAAGRSAPFRSIDIRRLVPFALFIGRLLLCLVARWFFSLFRYERRHESSNEQNRQHEPSSSDMSAAAGFRRGSGSLKRPRG